LRAVIDIGSELASERDADRLLPRVCQAAQGLFGATFVTLGILDPSDRSVQRVDSCGADAADWIRPGDVVPGLLRTVVSERRTLRGNNPGGDPAGVGLPSCHPHIQAFLAAPVASAAHVYGWICLVGNEGRSFTDEDEQLVVALSVQVGAIYELAHEILERTRAESALRHERLRTRRYLDSANVILLVLDRDGRITLINRKGCDLLGWSEGELLGRDWFATCVPVRMHDASRPTFDGLAAGDPAVIESPVVTRSGVERLMEWHNTALRDDDGCRIGTLGSGTDITERRQAEEAQRASERRYRALFEYAPDGIVIADHESFYLDANPSMCRMLGYSLDEFVGLHASDIVEQAEVEHIAPALKAIETTSDYHREWQFKRKDGSLFTADVIATPMPDGNLLGVIRDVTARNQAIEALRTTEERMRFALENAGIGIWDMDYHTGVLRWSAILEAQYGLAPGTFDGTFQAFAAGIHPDDRESALATLADAMKAGSDFSIQHRTAWPDGTVRWLSGTGRSFVGRDGRPLRAVGISQDVTERKHAEATLGQSEARKSAILDSVLDAIITMDANGRVVELNDSAERTFGYTKAEAIGRSLADLIVPAPLRAAHTAGLARYLATGEGRLLGQLTEITAMRSDGVAIPVELTITAIHSHGAPIFTGVLRDITARKQADETRARLAAIVDSSDDAIFSTSMDGTVVTWNTGAEQLYGYRASDVIGRNRRLLVTAAKGDELTDRMDSAARGEPGEPFETQGTRNGGSTIDISITVSPMTDSTGSVTGVSTIARDISSRKKAEAEVQRLNDEIRRQRLRVFKATIRTVQDIVNNLLNSFQLVRLEGEGYLPAELLTLVDGMIEEASIRLRTLGDLETVSEREMEMGLGIDYPGSG
jgi:PAS domain S-box-containing protein